jgi:YD repeat-containing protein
MGNHKRYGNCAHRISQPRRHHCTWPGKNFRLYYGTFLGLTVHYIFVACARRNRMISAVVNRIANTYEGFSNSSSSAAVPREICDDLMCERVPNEPHNLGLGPMADRERWQLRGPVRSCQIERTWYSRRCGADTCDIEERRDATTVDFGFDGNLYRQSHRNPDGSEWTSTYEYDHAGRLIQIRTENPDGVANLQLYEYDDNGRLRRVLARNGGGDRIAETYEYEASGRKTKTLHMDLAAQRPDTHYSWGVEGTDSAYSARGAATLTTAYNHRGQPSQLSFRDVAGRELSRVEFRYDDAGCLVEEAQTNSEEVLPPEMLGSLNAAQLQTVRGLFGIGGESIRRTHAYDEQRRRIETRSNIGPLGFDKKTVIFNENDDPLIEVYEHEERDYGIDEAGRIADNPSRENVSRSEARFRYEYDSEGNWLSKTVESRSGSADRFSLSAVERRSITYFG